MSTPTQTYCSWEAVHQRVADGLMTEKSLLHPAWPSICAQATKDAAAELKRVFVLKGYTPAALASSDDAAVWNERLGAFYAFTRGTALASYDLKSVEYLNCTKEFTDAAALVIDGSATGPAPNESDVGGIADGAVKRVREAACRFDRF